MSNAEPTPAQPSTSQTVTTAATGAHLAVLKGPQPGRQFPLRPSETVLGRQADSHVSLESQAVSRHHARILCEEDRFFVEDMQSSNGTYVNGKRVHGRVPLTPEDTLQVGPYVMALRLSKGPAFVDSDVVIRSQVSADPSRLAIQGQDATSKLKVVLEIAQHLARTLDPELLLGKLLDHLMGLFPQADRGMVVLCEGDALAVRAQRFRTSQDLTNAPYSRTVVRRALDDGLGLLSEDICADQRFQGSSTVASLQLRCLMCVPMICQDGRRLGVIQLDSTRHGRPFRVEDLELVTAVALQAAVVLDNAALHAELLREERLRREVAIAQDIQKSFLPTNFPDPAKVGFELFARIVPAREVSGDLYDFFPLRDGRWAFFVGDVAGKGIPAALFIIAIRTLSRHVAASGTGPADTLARLNAALAEDNLTGVFVTILHGVYDPATGEVALASGGHPAPLLRRGDGSVEEVPVAAGRFLGYAEGGLQLADHRLRLEPGEMLVLYTDGFSEAHPGDTTRMFGVPRLKEALAACDAGSPLEAVADRVRAAADDFVGRGRPQQDDQTLLILRRVR